MRDWEGNLFGGIKRVICQQEAVLVFNATKRSANVSRAGRSYVSFTQLHLTAVK